MRLKLSILFLFISVTLLAQNKPAFWDDIQAFKKQDSAHFPEKGQILFTGSSSFTNWKDVNEYFPGYHILNRGFGGSTLPDLIRYTQDVVYPYQPRQIVIYCGENDFASSDTVSVPTVVLRFKTLFALVRKKYKNVPLAYVSMKPSPSRAHLMPKYVKANAQIKAFLAKQKKTDFIDVYSQMLKPDGTPIDGIWRDDKLHMTAKGYAIWQKIMEPYLKK